MRRSGETGNALCTQPNTRRSLISCAWREMGGGLPLRSGRHHFFDSRSFGAALSSIESANSFFNRARSSCFFYVRALKNRRLGSISDVAKSKALAEYSALCGKTLARAHARSGELALIAGYMGKSEVMDEALASFLLRSQCS